MHVIHWQPKVDVAGMADTSAALISAGEVGVADRLWHATSFGQPEYRRAAAAAALGRLVRRNLLRPLPVDRLIGLVEDDSLDRYARIEVLKGIGYLPAEIAPPLIVEWLRRSISALPPGAGESREATAADFRLAALAALARLGLLTSDPDALRHHLGLRQEGTTWRWERSIALPGTPLVMGFLYSREPVLYAQAAADLLREGDWTTVVQLSPFLRSGLRPVPEAIVDSILERIRRAGPEMGEPELLPLLADIAPGRIVSESLSGMFGWPPQVRAALAEALARSPTPADLDRRENLLLVLMGDGQYGVRREAFRAMARINPRGLRSLCTAWALLTESNVGPLERPFVIDMRRRAAEAAAWLESVPVEGPIADLACDSEPEVRAIFVRCQRERRDRDWASVYLRQVLAANDNASLLTAWKYGRALERVGDDDALDRLEERRGHDVPPGVRHWIGRLIKTLRARWDDVTRSWPEPWFAQRGRLERVDARVGQDDATMKIVSCWLWQVPATDLLEFGVWGGWCVDEYLPVAMQTLRVPGRQPATILVTQASMGTGGKGPTYFKGSGPYPDPVTLCE